MKITVLQEGEMGVPCSSHRLSSVIMRTPLLEYLYRKSDLCLLCGTAIYNIEKSCGVGGPCLSAVLVSCGKCTNKPAVKATQEWAIMPLAIDDVKIVFYLFLSGIIMTFSFLKCFLFCLFLQTHWSQSCLSHSRRPSKPSHFLCLGHPWALWLLPLHSKRSLDLRVPLGSKRQWCLFENI